MGGRALGWAGLGWPVVARSCCRRSTLFASGRPSSALSCSQCRARRHQSNPCLPRHSAQAAGRDTTAGAFDEAMYRYAISPEAQESHNVEQCYKVLH